MSDPGLFDDEVEEEIVEASDPEQERQAAMEAEARRAGWRPQEEYRGPPGQWRTAEEFLRRGQDILPIVRKDLAKERERSAKMEEEIRTLRAGFDEQRLVMEDLLKMARTASDAGYKRAMDELKAQKLQAAQNGDMASVVAIDEKIDEVREERAAATAAPKPVPAQKTEDPPPQQRQQLAPEVQQFIKDNPWFNSDPVLNRAMEAEHMLLLDEDPTLTLSENLEAAKEAVMQKFPKKFGIKPKAVDEEEPEPAPRPRRVTPVAAPSAPTNQRRAVATGIASIEDQQERASAQMAFNRAKRQMPDLTEREWFSVYENPKIDADDMKSNRAKKERTNAAR